MVGIFLPKQRVLDFPITALRFDDQIQTILRWAIARESKTVCVANVHMLMEAHWNRYTKTIPAFMLLAFKQLLMSSSFSLN
jgi:UDP-N-acetyl-D-mannosaminuronic acid transferase (WecB/TagA/CpsF family)